MFPHDSFDNRVLHLIETGNASGLEEMLSADTHLADRREANAGQWLVEAIFESTPEVLEVLLRYGFPINSRAQDGYTPLHACVDSPKPWRYDALKMLINNRADLNIRGLNDWTPLHIAAARNDIPALKMLLEAGADVSQKTSMDAYATPEEEAVQAGAIDAANFLREWRIQHSWANDKK